MTWSLLSTSEAKQQTLNTVARLSVAVACLSVLCPDVVCAAHVLWLCDYQHSVAFSREYGSIITVIVGLSRCICSVIPTDHVLLT